MAQKIAGITAKLGLDVTGVTSALNRIEKESKNIAKEMRDVDKAFKIDPNSMVLAAQKQELLAQAITNTEAKLKELESVQEKTDKAFANQSKWEEKYKPLKASIDETKNKLKELQSQNEKMQEDFASGKISTDQYEKYKQELEATKQKMSELKQAEKDLEAEFADGHISAEEYRTFQRELETTRAQLNNLQSEAKENEQAMRDIGDGVDRASEEYRRGKQNVMEYGDAVGDLNSSINKVGSDLRGLATAAAAAVTAVTTAAVKAVGEATEVGMEFEASMSKVAAISGATGEDLQSLEDAAKKMGATTSKTASESAQALSYMALAGWDTEQMLTGLEPVLRASEAGEMDLARCSDLVTDSMSAMGVSVNDLSHYLDVVAATQSNTNTSMEQLLEAFIECGGTAQNFGISVEDLSASLGVMANRGIKGSEAGNALNSIFVNMLGSTKKTAEAMEMLGLNLYDSEGNMKDMTEVLKEMGTALESATDEQRNNIEAMLGGKTQLTALQALVGGLNGEYDDLSATLSDVDGALMNTAKTMQDNLQGQLTATQSALEGLGIDVYEHLEEPFKGAVRSITEEIGKLSESVQNGQLGDSLDKLADKLFDVIGAAAKFAADKGIPALIKSLDWIITNGNNIIAILKGVAAGFAAWKVAQLTTDIMGMVKAIQAFKVAQEAATEAQIAANAAAMANVYAAVAAAIALVTVALGELVAAQIDAAAEELRHKNELDDTVKALRDEAAAIDDLNRKTEENCRNVDESADAAQRWWKKIQDLTDETGVCTGNIDDLQVAVNALNEITGENIQLVGNQIIGYNELSESIEKVIEKQRMQSKLDYLKEPYGEAVTKLDGAKKSLEEAEKAEEEAYNEYEKILDIQKRKASGELTDSEHEYVGITEETMQKLVDDARDKYAQSIVATSALRDQVNGYNEAIDNYENAYKELNTPDSSNTYGKGKAAGDSFAEGVADSTDTLSATVEECIASAYNSAEAEGKSIGSAAAEGIKAAMDSGMKDADLKKLVASYMDDLELEQLKNGFDNSWLYDEMEKVISVLDESSDAYKKYEKTILQGRKRIADSAEKESEKEEKAVQKANDKKLKEQQKQDEKEQKQREKAEKDSEKQRQKELESAEKDAEKAAEKLEQLKSKYQTDMGDIFTTKSTTDARTGSTNSENIIDTLAIEKKIKAKEQLNGLIGQLMEKDVPQSIIDALLSMDPEAAVDYARQLLRSPEKLGKIKKLGERDEKASEALAKRSLIDSGELAKAGETAGNVYADKLTETIFTKLAEKLPDLSGMLGNILPAIKTSGNTTTTTQTVENGAQTNISDNADKQTALLETILGIINASLVEKGLNVTVNPVVETTVTLDGEAIAKSTTKKQDESKVRSNG